MHLSPALVVSFSLGSLLLGSGCTELTDLVVGEPVPDLEHPQQVGEEVGLTFEIPGNWRFEVERDPPEDGISIASVTAESSGSGMVTLQVFRPGIDIAPGEFIDSMVESMPEVLQEMALGALLSKIAVKRGSKSDVTRTLLGKSRLGASERYELILDDDVSQHHLEVFTLGEADFSLVLNFEAEKGDKARVSPVFDHVAKTLKIVGERPRPAAPAKAAPAPQPGPQATPQANSTTP